MLGMNVYDTNVITINTSTLLLTKEGKNIYSYAVLVNCKVINCNCVFTCHENTYNSSSYCLDQLELGTIIIINSLITWS